MRIHFLTFSIKFAGLTGIKSIIAVLPNISHSESLDLLLGAIFANIDLKMESATRDSLLDNVMNEETCSKLAMECLDALGKKADVLSLPLLIRSVFK